MILHLDDQHCRYLACPPGFEGRFRPLVKDLVGFELPRDLEPLELVRHGWIEPVLRIELPKSFYLSWENFPSYPSRGTIAKEDCWASHLWALGALSKRGSADPKGAMWYRHLLDTPDHWVTRAALVHQLPTDGSGTPESFEHSRPPGRKIFPWIDFFAHWQAYHVKEILGAVIVSGAPRLPGAKRRLEDLLAKADELEELAQTRLEAIRRRWERRREVFDWLSRFRTIHGIWTHENPIADTAREERFHDAAKAVVREAALDVESLKLHIREHLLTLWSEWSHLPQTDRAKLLLQQDIALAVMLVELIQGGSVSYDDPFWGYPTDGELRKWAPLPSVLPFEADNAKIEFSSHADIVLSDSTFNQVVPKGMQLDETSIERLTAKWWPHSAAFRRFALSYDRLYGHDAGRINEQRLVGIEEETPIEFLILCALHIEKLLGELLAPDPPGEVNKRVRVAACRIAKPYGIQGQQAFLKELAEVLHNKTQLHDLPQKPRDPFLKESDFKHPEPVARLFLKAFANFKVLRNYSAHHDCIDTQLFQQGWVTAGVEALMIITLAILTVSRVPSIKR